MKKLYPILIIFLVLLVENGFSQEDTTIKDSTSTENSIPTILLSESDFEGDMQVSDISDLLQSAQDQYTKTAGYVFGQARYRIRGYDNKYVISLLNGLKTNNAETGRPYYGSWGGLNDVTRYKTNYPAMMPCSYNFGGISNTVNISLRPSEFKKQASVSYALSNQSYAHRVMMSYHTGLLPNNWAFSACLSTRLAPTNSFANYGEGNFYEGYSYFISAEKKINNSHTISLTAFGAPLRRSRSSVAIQEVYDLAGTNYYNSNWGYQNGKVRNARVSNSHQPYFVLSHYWKIDEKSKLNTNASFVFGKYGSTSLNWADAADPRPDYYKYLPSYYNETDDMFSTITSLWQNNEETRQIQWDELVFANSKNLYTITNEGGVSGNNVTGNRAKYIVEERVSNVKRLDLNSVYTRQFDDNLLFTAGLNAMINKTNNYKELSDLLGADFWLDIDNFAERDFTDEQYVQNDIDNPNRAIKVGDRFGYDYVANINNADVFAQIEANYDKINMFFAFDLSYTNFWRYSPMTNGKFLNNSGGNSPKQNFFNNGTKIGATIKLSGHHYILLNTSFKTVAPYFYDAYVSPRTREFLISDITEKALESEKIMSAELSYVMKYQLVSLKITGYYTEFIGGTQNNNFYDDDQHTFVNYIMTDVNRRHFGGEFGAEVKLSPTVNLTSAVGYGQFLYSSRPSVTIAADNSSEILVKDRIAYIKNFHVGGCPEFAANLGVRYNSPKFWYIGADVNYFDNIYVTINPNKRTETALEGLTTQDSQINDILEQEKINPIFSVNLSAGKSWKIKNYTLGFNANINNILHNKLFDKWFSNDFLFQDGVVMSGFEQYRFEKTKIDKFPNKYTYMYGTTFYLNVYFRF